MVSFERESRWIRVNGILPESLRETNSHPTSDPVKVSISDLVVSAFPNNFEENLLTGRVVKK